MHEEFGWRLHHFFEDENGKKISWLNFALQHNPRVLFTDIVTISEDSLLDDGSYKILLFNGLYRSNLLRIYLGYYKCALKSNEILQFIDELEKEARDIYLKKELQDVKKIFYFEEF